MNWNTFQPWRKRFADCLLVIGAVVLAGCGHSPPFYESLPFVKQKQAPYRIYRADFSTAWDATLQAVTLGRDVIRLQNRDLGVIETDWIDNTSDHAFLQVFSDEDFFLRSRYRLQVQLREGTKNGDAPVVMVRVLKYQQMERTFLSGWEDVESDGIDEDTYLYLIGRKIALKNLEPNKK